MADDEEKAQKGLKEFKTTILASIAGQSLELYDFYIYGSLAVVIGDLFFPTQDPWIALISSLAIFAAGFLVRPLGALLFGYGSDRFGRKTIFIVTLSAMAFSTVMVGLLPVYAQWGALSQIILLTLRAIQGLSVGGESMGSVVYLLEHAPADRRGFVTSFLFPAALTGWLLATLVNTVVNYILTPEEFYSWGWRIPFLLGILTGLTGLVLRLKARETPVFEDMRSRGTLAENPILEIIKTAKIHTLAIMAITCVLSLDWYITLVYLPIHMNKVGGLSLYVSYFINFISALWAMVLIPAVGFLSDKIGRSLPLYLGALGILILSPYIFYLASQNSVQACVLASIIATVLLSVYCGPIYALAAEWFPPHIRASGAAMSFNLIGAFVGGTAPLAAAVLMHWLDTPLAPGYYLSIWALVALLVLSFYDNPYTEAGL